MNLLLGMLLCVSLSDPVVVVTNPEPVTAHAGETLVVTVPLEIAEGFHLQAQPADSPFLVPLELTSSCTGELRLVSVEYPAGVPDPADEGHALPLCYVGEVELSVSVRVDDDVKPGAYTLRGALRYQACSTRLCLAPDSSAVEVAVNVRAAAAPTQRTSTILRRER